MWPIIWLGSFIHWTRLKDSLRVKNSFDNEFNGQHTRTLKSPTNKNRSEIVTKIVTCDQVINIKSNLFKEKKILRQNGLISYIVIIDQGHSVWSDDARRDWSSSQEMKISMIHSFSSSAEADVGSAEPRARRRAGKKDRTKPVGGKIQQMAGHRHVVCLLPSKDRKVGFKAGPQVSFPSGRDP